MKTNKTDQRLLIPEPVTSPAAESADNILDFSSTLRELRRNVDPSLLRQREGWRDRRGNVTTVDCIEWHSVADILDKTAPNWMHTVKDIRSIGEYVVVTVAITIDGIRREGIGTGSARSETGIKKAEHDALKRAAVKFGIARDLYKKDFEAIDAGTGDNAETVPSDPIGRSISDLITTKQLGMIRALARERDIDADAECMSIMKCQIGELSRKAASFLIDRLQSRPKAVPMKMAG